MWEAMLWNGEWLLVKMELRQAYKPGVSTYKEAKALADKFNQGALFVALEPIVEDVKED